MLIPLRTDRPLKRKPYVTEALLVLNLAVYLLGLIGEYAGVITMEQIIDFGHFDPRHFTPWGPVTYQFLHDPSAIWHLAFNMLFLWVFGCAVEDRLGPLVYLAFYLIGGVTAAFVHMAFRPAPVIGASGSIAAVTGAFLALFPRSRIKVLFFFILIGLFNIPSLWFIGLYFTIDVLRQVVASAGGEQGAVAYMAHIAGYIYGFGVAFVMLATGVLPREDVDIFYLFKQWRRRAAFRTATHGTPGGQWDAPSADTGRRAAAIPTRRTADDSRRSDQRGEVNRLIRSHDLPGAAAAYETALLTSPSLVLPEGEQLDIGNQLYADGRHEAAASAYDLFLEAYGNSHQAGQVTLLLGLLMARQLNQPVRAAELLRRARAIVRDTEQQALADQVLSELST